MISDIASFLRYFGGIHRRTVRDVSALPTEDERNEWVVEQREVETRRADGP